jgi:broad specificity phosphatase PhoE
MTVIHFVQHAQKQPTAGDPGLTEHGHRQAAVSAERLQNLGVRAVYSSPLRRALETARPLASTTGLITCRDESLQERMNWDGVVPLSDFFSDWQRATDGRDYWPRGGESSRAAGERLRSFVLSVQDVSGPIAAVTHGGVTVDLLRTLLGDEKVPPSLIADGVPACAITTLDGLRVVSLPSTERD